LLLLSVIFVGGLAELKHLNNDEKRAPLYITASLIGIIFLFAHHFFTGEFQSFLPLLFTALVFALFIHHLFLKNSENSFDRLKSVIFSTTYLWLPLALAINLSYYGGKWQPFVVLSLFIFIWANDTFAYLFGKWLGKHKLLERISPKKSIEGFVGGLIGTVAIGYIISTMNDELTIWQWCIFAALISISSTIGDLFQSSLKRSAGVKDSGTILPGHGGILDRLDSFFFAAPMAYFYLIIFA
jgi:phosphatidate cytidylyltransferase